MFFAVIQTCLIHSTMLCCSSTSSSLIRVINSSLLGHCTAAPSSNKTSNFIFSRPSLDSGAFPKHMHSGTTSRVIPSSSSYNPFTFFMIASKFLTLPKISAWSSSPASLVIWQEGSGSIWRYTWCRMSPLKREEYSDMQSGFGRHDFTWKIQNKTTKHLNYIPRPCITIY